MSNNPIPKNLKVVLAMAEDCHDGCVDHQDSVGLKQTRAPDLSALIVSLKGNAPTSPVPPGAPPPPPPPPPSPGLIYLYDESKVATDAALTAMQAKDEEVRQFLTQARTVLSHPLGKSWSAEWVLAGFTETGSTAVPNTQDERFASINTIAIYLTQHPQHEVPGGGPMPEVTASRAQSLHMQLSDARTAVNDATNAQKAAKAARDDAGAVLRKRLIAFVDELTLLLGSDDPRWELFGLNIPSSPRAPDPATDLVLTAVSPGRILAEWSRGTRSNNHRVLIQLLGTDPDYREYARSGDSLEKLISDQPTGATLKVKIIALNGSLEAPDGPEAQITVP
ncbi:MAG: hypothetical protein IPK22_18390 [Verrucomicrobiaceae bacterium]|nr:hypothetical protein [Verrucomicrobiaceae bacterium]